MAIFTLYNLNVVKEKSGRFDVERKITSSTDISNIGYDVLELNLKCEEYLMLLTLDTKNNVTGMFEVSHGTLNSSLIHPREVFKRALMQNASSIILLHNHPSGDTTPSAEDINVTKRIKASGEMLGIELLDHVIIGDNGDYKALRHPSFNIW